MPESYLHKYAKVVLASWLRRLIGKNHKGINNMMLQVQTKESAPMFNVYTEYPVCKDIVTDKLIGIDTPWSGWLTQNSNKVKSKNGIPTKFELKKWKDQLLILSIFDIAVLDDNRPKYAFEIKYTHAMGKEKINFVKEHNIETYEIDAHEVMECTKLPYNLNYINKY